MKKLKLIATSAVVLAIVGGAFAFNAKKGAYFCYSATTTITCKSVHLENQKIVTNVGNAWHYYSGWDGDETQCSGRPNCTTLILLTDD